MKLGVNIDHIATLRNARGDGFPNILNAALVCKEAGANSITAHLREDRRHIKDEDIKILKQHAGLPLNLEMAATEEMLKIACNIKPTYVCLVPEKREELTTEGGLNVALQQSYLQGYVKELQKHGISVSLFVEPSLKQLEACLKCNTNSIEIHTGTYANTLENNQNQELDKIKKIAKEAFANNIGVHAGHGLNYNNVQNIALIKEISELNIGFAIVAKSIFIGLKQAVEDMKTLIHKS